MALDLMEPVRPEAEAFVLDMLASRTFRKAEFSESEEGQVRLRAPLTHELAETMPRWARSLAPVAEKVAHMLGHAMDGKYTPATPLTSAKLRSAQAIVKARKTEAVGRATRAAAKQRPAAPAALPLYSCPDCGGPVTNPRHALCETCQAGAGHTAAVRQTRGRAIAARKRALKERVDAFGADVDLAIYRERILAEARGREVGRDHGGHRLQQGALLDHQGRDLDAARVDLASPGPTGRRRGGARTRPRQALGEASSGDYPQERRSHHTRQPLCLGQPARATAEGTGAGPAARREGPCVRLGEGLRSSPKRGLRACCPAGA